MFYTIYHHKIINLKGTPEDNLIHCLDQQWIN